MSIRFKITMVVATSMAAILAINNLYLTSSTFFGVNGEITNKLGLLIAPISILLICTLIYYVIGIYSDRLELIKNSLKRIQKNEIVSFPFKTKDEIGDMMLEIEDVSNRLNTQDKEMKMFQEENLRFANTDSLTGLPNRDYFLKGLEHAEKSRSAAIIVTVVLKDILKLNALQGSDIAVQVLHLVVQRLKAFSPWPAIFGRMSTNHLSIFFETSHMVNRGVVAEELQDYFQKISAPFEINGEQIFIKVQFGIALRQPNETIKLQTLLHLADLAVMEESGSIGQNVYLSHALLQEEQAYKQQMEFALRKSLEERDFLVVYQPIVSLNHSQMALETLVRWKYEGEWISPMEFIPVLEEIGLIEELTKQVIDAVINDWRSWKSVIPELSHISLNISARIFEHGEGCILSYLLNLVNENGMKPSDICLEITENVLLDEHTIEFVELSMKEGFLIAVDDFGTGYSSMSYIANYPFDVLKIDREFVIQLETNEKKREVAHAIVRLAKRLGIKVVAEGVETEEQLNILQEMGTDAVQGYYFSKPQFLNEWDPLHLDERRKIHTNV